MVLLFLLFMLAGCRHDPDGSHPKDTGPDSDPLDTATPDQSFEIEIFESSSAGQEGVFSWASVNNHWTESAWEPSLQVGDCIWYEVRPNQPCDPACQPGEYCTWDGICVVPDPPLNAGTIVVQGLDVALSLEPVSKYVYYNAIFDPKPEGALFGAGDLIRATAPGADVPAFEVETTGVALLETDLDCPLEPTSGMPLQVRWTPGTACPGGDPIRLILQSGNHGGQFPALICETADDGSLEVDATLVDAWLGSWRPVESWSIARYHEGRITEGGIATVLRAQSATTCYW